MRTTLPPKLAEDIQTARQTEALAVVQRWLESPRRTLILEGGTGAGKSIAAAWAFAHRAYRGVSAVWAYVPDVASIAEWKTDEWEVFDSAGFIVLDDLGTERDRKRAAQVLERLSNVARGRSVITTNIPADEVLELYGIRVQSRIIGEADWVTLGGEDLRVSPPGGEASVHPWDPTSSEREAAEQRRREREEEDRHALSSEQIGEMAERFLARHPEQKRSPADEKWRDHLRSVVDRAAVAEEPAWGRKSANDGSES